MLMLFVVGLVLFTTGFVATTIGDIDLRIFGVTLMLLGVLIESHTLMYKVSEISTVKDIYQNKISVDDYAENYDWEKDD